MTDYSRKLDALLCMMCWTCEEMYKPDTLYPVLDERLCKDFIVRAYIVGDDCLFRKAILNGPQKRFYGMILEAKQPQQQYYVVLRGTNGTIEWIEDAEYRQVPHDVAGKVEAGFWGIYKSLRAVPCDTTTLAPSGTEVPLVPLIRSLGGAPTQYERHPPAVYTVGHSLGAALATYLGAEVAAVLSPGVFNATTVFASPRPGDKDFCDWVNATCPLFRGWNYSLDLVPYVPLLFGYQHPQGTKTISPFDADTRVKISLGCNHHALSYMAMLDRTSIYLPGVFPYAKPYLGCFLGQLVEHKPNPIEAMQNKLLSTNLNVEQSIAVSKLRAQRALEPATECLCQREPLQSRLRRALRFVKSLPHLLGF